MSKRRDYEYMEERRLQGARLLEDGVSQAEVARQLGVKRQSVHEWAKVMAAQGEKGLARVPTGRKPRLNAVQLSQLAEHSQNGPEAHGYPRRSRAGPRGNLSLNSTIASLAVTTFLNAAIGVPGAARHLNYNALAGILNLRD